MNEQRWDPVSKLGLISFGVGAGFLLLVLFLSQSGFVFLIDHANLLFHEAGHPIVGIFSERLEPYGGTVGQLVFPVVLAVSFWKKRQPLQFAAATIWFFENFLNIARYMADSRALELPLVGGGEHDWNEILFRWNVLAFDTQIAGAVEVVGWIGISSACLWVGWRAWTDRGRIIEASEKWLP